MTEPASTRRTRLGVFVSGSGRTMVNLVKRSRDGRLDADVGIVIASRDRGALGHARGLGVPSELRPGEFSPADVDALVAEHQIDWIVLAGYLRKFPITPRVAGRVVNIHPGLLPGDGSPGPFGGPGMHGIAVHRAVIDAYARGEITESGCTVHLCDDGYDSGPVVLRKTCKVLASDSPETLAQRVFALELDAYPEALQRLITESRTRK
ncbi:MAG: formyltransferase family protein [Planctomycetota bacterium]